MSDRCGHCYRSAVATVTYRTLLARLLRHPAQRRRVCAEHLDRYRKGGRAVRRAG